MRPVGDLAAMPPSIRDFGDIPARIPGCVHTDLMRAGLIPDPRVGTNEKDLHWIGRTDWEYRCTFELKADNFTHDRIDLACNALDAIAELSLNGVPIGAAANAFHPHRFDLRPAARPGRNELIIRFRAPVNHILAESHRIGLLPHNGDGLGWLPYNFIRKPACNFGWDWAPNVATCGITQAIRLELWSSVRIADVVALPRRSAEGWILEVAATLEWAKRAHVHPLVLITNVEAAGASLAGTELTYGATSCRLQLDQLTVDEWWPRGVGEQQLYALNLIVAQIPPGNQTPIPRPVETHGTTESVLASVTRTVAFREAHLNTNTDEHGNRFQLEINGTPVFCKGANWIPEGLFPDDRSEEKIRERVQQAAAANINMLRVWGGGAYECDAFYDECDKLGIMVWQDFMFACACYPEEAPFPQLIEAEARHQIARLSTHPSVVLWCGGNECVWGYESWGYAASDVAGPWKKRVGERGWGGAYWFDLLPRLLREIDPTRPYWPNSPFCGVVGEPPNQQAKGNRHTWDSVFLDRPTDTPATSFRAIVPRFCTEFGHQAPANMETLAEVLKPEELSITSPALEHHQRATGGIARHINDAMASVGPVPTEFAAWHARAQELQAIALRNGVEHHAAHRQDGRCMGVLIWQFNDAWPGMSWSLIDSAGRSKPAYHAVRDAFGKID